MDPCQPKGHNFPHKLQSEQMRSFIDTWYKRFDWLEYSVEKDAAFFFFFFFYLYLFKPPRIENYGNDAFTKKGSVHWRNGLETFTAHVAKVDRIHNNARKHALAFKNQR
jgi:hypothetical protein